MTDVLLGPSYYLRFDPKLWQAMQPYPPLGTMYAASVLRERGYHVALFDAMLAESERDWEGALQAEAPRFAVLYEDNFNYLSKMCLLRMRHAAFSMMRMARQRGCTVIAGGADATDHARTYLAEGADYVLLGEGERTLVELMDRLTGRSSTPLASIQGLAFVDSQTGRAARAETGGVRRTPPRPLIRNLDALPFPAWDMVDVPKYKEIWERRHGSYSMNVVTTRGCPYHCNWCAKPIWGQRYHARSPENVVDELQWLMETYVPDHIWFVDDIMGLEPGWMTRFADLMEARGIHVPFKCLNRPDLLLRDGEVDAFRRAGCETVWIGAESGAQRILDAMEKGTTVDQIQEATGRLHAAGIRTGFFLQFGYPGETRADIDQTLRMVRECRPDDIGISVSYPLPGTRFYERVKDQMKAQRNWRDSEDLAMLYRGPFSTAFYRQLHTVTHKTFRLRRIGGEMLRLVRRPQDLEVGHLRRALAMVFHALTLPLERWRLRRLENQTEEPSSLPSPELPRLAAAAPSHQTRTTVEPDPTPASRRRPDVLLTHGYFLCEDPGEAEIMRLYPPLGLLYLSSYLKSRGFDVEVYDTTFRDPEGFREVIGQNPPPVVGIYANLITRGTVVQMARFCQRQGCTVVVGGPEPANYPEEYLAHGADVVVVGEGEGTLEELLPHLAQEGPRDLELIRGIVYRDGADRVVRTPPRPHLPDLDVLPFPDRSAVDLEEYLTVWRERHGQAPVSLISARGCPYRCTWCSHAVFGYSQRRRSPQNVADELEVILDAYDPDYVWYADDVFAIDDHWLQAYADELNRRGIHAPFEATSRVDRLDERVVQTLAAMGCRRLWLGAESGSQRILDAMDRRIEARRVPDIVRLLQRCGIEVGLFVMFGYEGETEEDLEATADMLSAARPDEFLTTVVYPIKGTPYYERVADRIVPPGSWERGCDRDLVVAGRASDRYYRLVTRWLVNRVRWRSEWERGNRFDVRTAKAFVNAQVGRLGMARTRGEVAGG